MSTSRIIQYIHRPTLTELGWSNMHDRYLVVDSDKDLSNVFPLGKEVNLVDTNSQKVYKVYSKIETNEFRLKRLGAIVDDYHMEPGDEIVITHYELSDNVLDMLTVNECGRIFLNPGKKKDGKIEDYEIVNIERLPGFSEKQNFTYACEYNGIKNDLYISFTGSRKKRSDSPDETKFYSVKFGQFDLDYDPKSYYYLTIRNDVVVLKSLPKSNYCVLLDSQDSKDPKGETLEHNNLHVIYYGAPGTGKSHKIEELTSDAEKNGRVFRTTFHPDSDYSTFVGCYKPSMRQTDKIYSAEELAVKLKEIKNSGVTYPCHKFSAQYWRSLKDLSGDVIKQILTACGFTESMNVEISKGVAIGQEYLNKEEDGKIIYSFTPQAFTNAYVKAWNSEEDVYLIIEEINRGNCAQIFGDLFQLLDRKDGVSEYPIDADSDLANYICQKLENSTRSDFPDGVKEGKKLVLPKNLYIWATMNTSDQSLFPIDSAFKRRWEWKYIPIKDHKEKNYKIEIGGCQYRWWGFLEKINKVIGVTTSSEDKKLGYFFVKTENTIITAEQFVGKVLFYLWNDVFKNYAFDNSIFNKEGDGKYAFSDFFTEDGDPNVNEINDFMHNLDEKIDKEHSFVYATKDDPTELQITYNGEPIEGDSATRKYIETIRRIVVEKGGDAVSQCIGADLTKNPIDNTRRYEQIDQTGWYLATNVGIDKIKSQIGKIKQSLGVNVDVA